MNVLEKILEEIEKEQNSYEADHAWNYSKGLEYAKEIIRSHMGEKEKVTSAEIISEKIAGKTHYVIKYKNVGEDKYYFGYGSFNLDYVIEWLNGYFEFCEEAKVSCENDGWIPVEERLPEDDRYILLSFENFSLPLVGRYEENEKGGAFYIGDCDEEDTCASNDLFVNAWHPLPEPYRPKEKDDEWK